MQAVIFSIGGAVLNTQTDLAYPGVDELLVILRRMGLRIGAVTAEDFRAFVRLDELGIRHHFASVVSSERVDHPHPHPDALELVLRELNVSPEETVFVSNLPIDITLSKDAHIAKVVGVLHGSENREGLKMAGADYIVGDIPSLLDVIE